MANANRYWTKLTWKKLETDDGGDYARAKVPGGWLVKSSGGLTFVPAASNTESDAE